VKPDPEVGKWSPHRRAAVADASGAGHFGPNPATNPNFTHPGHRPPGTNETKRKIETAEESTS
jgi:hypothetical protein